MSKRVVTQLPSAMSAQVRRALLTIGWKLSNPMPLYLPAKLPRGWSQQWDKEQQCMIYRDSWKRPRGRFYPNAVVTALATNPHGEPVALRHQIQLPHFELLARFEIQYFGPDDYRVYDHLELKELCKWNTVEMAELWLRNNIGENWDDPSANWPPEPKLPRWRRLMVWSH
jgi:hypothetical protein